jgi:pimeloyl-ACP methyl ester carboxylesterase
MRAREPDVDGYVEHEGVKLHYEVHGDGDPTVLLLPTWTIIHKRFWKAQVADLARRFRVVTYDGPGNGLSDRTLEPAAYDQGRQVAYALAVLDATGTDRAVIASLSQGSRWALDLAANHPARVLGTVYIGAGVELADRSVERRTYQDAAYAARPNSSRRGCRWLRSTRPSTGRRPPRPTCATTTRTSCGSSSASATPSRAPPSRSRTASPGGSRPTPRCSRPKPKGRTNRIARRSRRGAPGWRARRW